MSLPSEKVATFAGGRTCQAALATELTFQSRGEISMLTKGFDSRVKRLRAVAFFAVITIFSIHAFGTGKSGSGNLVFVTNWGDDTVSLVDIAKGREVSTIRVGRKPYDVKVDASGRYAYVSISGDSFISVIDIQAMLEGDRIAVGQSPREIDLSSDGKHAVVANSGDDSISYIDLQARKELFRVKVGRIPYGIGFAKNEALAVVSNWGESSVSLVDLTARKEVKKFAVGPLPYTVMVSQSAGIAIVTNFGADQASVIDVNQMALLPSIPLGRSPWGGSVTADGKLAVICNFFSAELSFISIEGSGSTGGGRSPTSPVIRETSRLQLLDSIRGEGSRAVAGPEGRSKNAVLMNDKSTAVTSDLSNNQLYIVDVAGQKVLRTIPVGKAPYGIAFLGR
jgi:YVTN family beta-propeller protein